MSSDNKWTTLGEYSKAKDKPVTKEERKAHFEWVEKTKPALEKALGGAIKEENDEV